MKINKKMISIEQIKDPIREEFKLFDKYFEEAFQTENELLSVVNGYLRDNKGKQIRPIMTFLAGKICGKTNDATINSAIALELLHTASLVHDDIVDDTYERRGKESVNAIWKNKISVLVGDYLLSQSLSIANKTQNLKILNEITNLGKELSEGELLQISNTKNIIVDEEKYLQVIRKKTAMLFSTCTKSGAISVNASDENIEKLRLFGELYGICFQIKDDIFDYISSEKEIGKPVGNDIREGKITLPLLYALKNSEDADEYIKILKDKDFSKENIDKLISFAINNKGIEYAEKRMNEFKNEAVKILDTFEDSDIKKSLIMTLEHTIQRKK